MDVLLLCDKNFPVIFFICLIDKGYLLRSKGVHFVFFFCLHLLLGIYICAICSGVPGFCHFIAVYSLYCSCMFNE